MAELRPQEQRYWQLVAKRKGVADARLDELRWLIEELRISFFAQSLRTPQPVSIKLNAALITKRPHLVASSRQLCPHATKRSVPVLVRRPWLDAFNVRPLTRVDWRHGHRRGQGRIDACHTQIDRTAR